MTTNPLRADRHLPNRWLVLALMLGIAIFNHADRYLLAALVEPIKGEFAVSDGFMGLLMGPAFAVLYSIMAIPFAIYADKHSRIRIIVVGCIVWSLFTALSGFVGDQENWVIKAHEEQGLSLVKIYEMDNWRAALMEKKA